MYKVYYLMSKSTKSYYVGMTKNSLQTRLVQHNSCAKRGIKSQLYNCMRKYKDFTIELEGEYATQKECCDREVELILKARESGHKLLNLAAGGNGGYVVPEEKKSEWKAKLSKKRQGRKPALGIAHTVENKQLFSKVSREYWDTQQTYNATEIVAYPFKDAREKFGISKTHYYRLKRATYNERS